MNIWYLICFQLFLNSLFILIDERYDVTYYLENDPNWNKTELYAGCYRLNRIFTNQTEFKLNQLKKAIINYLNGSNYKEERELFLSKLRSKDYFINRGFLCMIGNKDEVWNIITGFYELRFVFDKEMLQFYNLNYPITQFHKIIIHNLESPYSNCKIKKSNRFNCINNCNRNHNKLSKYYYHANEINFNEIIRINFDNNDKMVKDSETKCVNECKKQGNDCKLIYYKRDTSILGNQTKVTISRAYPLISEFDYWFQLIGLICLISNLSIASFLIKIIYLIRKRKKIIKKKFMINLIWKSLNYLKYLILSILLIYLYLLFYDMIKEYLNKRDYPIRREITYYESQLRSINLIICIPLTYMSNYQNKTLSELEDETNKFNLYEKHVEDIYLIYQNKKIEINYKLNRSKVFFYESKRCYQLLIEPNEYKYQNQLLITKLIIKFRYLHLKNNYEVRILPDNQNFNYHTYKIKSFFLFTKKEIRRSKFNKLYPCIENKDFQTKLDLINKCLNKKFIDNNQNLPKQLVINKDQFTNEKWTKLSTINSRILFVRYLNECKANYSRRLDCQEIEFIDNKNIGNLNDNKFRIELYYDVIKEIEEEPSIYKLLMELSSTQSIIFDLNVFNLITFLFNYCRIKFKKLFIYLLCLIGFSYHLWFIINEILYGDLIYSQHYEILKYFKIPNLVFCLKYDQNLIDFNHKLTYNYLDKITSELNINKLIYKIEYLNKFNQWIQFNNSNIDIFYFKDKKCFEIKFDLEFKLDQFEYKYDFINKIIKLNLNNSFIDENKISFTSKIANTNQFSKISRYFSDQYEISIELVRIEYTDKFNLIKNPLSILYDQNKINNADKYLNNLIDNFRINFNLVTLNLPLNNLNNLTIDDQLFDQYYLQIQNLTDHNQPLNPNFKRTFINDNLKKAYFKYSSINLIFFKKLIKITNEDNYTNLILNLLNLVSLWFNLSLFDLKIYFDLVFIKIRFIFILWFKLLIKIKRKLFVNLF